MRDTGSATLELRTEFQGPRFGGALSIPGTASVGVEERCPTIRAPAEPEPLDRNEKVKIDLPFEEALRALLKTPVVEPEKDPAGVSTRRTATESLEPRLVIRFRYGGRRRHA